eukprot:m.498239 g.498239  ORF g.498239 m.498239 type:complete len:91 (+) comp53549_c0_seq1:3164-3436(+)
MRPRVGAFRLNDDDTLPFLTDPCEEHVTDRANDDETLWEKFALLFGRPWNERVAIMPMKPGDQHRWPDQWEYVCARKGERAQAHSNQPRS